MTDILAPFAYLHEAPKAKATLKQDPKDFRVVEDLGFEFSGAGEHLMLQIEKTGENTSFIANELAKVCDVPSKAIGWAGLKDRHAVTTQWFSVQLPSAQAPDLSKLEAQYKVRVLKAARHHQKLRPGMLVGNAFEITLRDITDMDDLLARLEKLDQVGIPNYFGEQRFGNKGNNLNEARRWGRDNVRTRNQNKRSLYLSTARSWIFNHILSKRIQAGVFNTLIEGDIVLDDSAAQILVDANNIQDLQQKLNNKEVKLTAALAGDNALPTKAKALELEQPCLDAEEDLMKLIRGNRMAHDRRPVALEVSDLTWEKLGESSILIRFSLPAGSFATMLLREIAVCTEPERVYPQKPEYKLDTWLQQHKTKLSKDRNENSN